MKALLGLGLLTAAQALAAGQLPTAPANCAEAIAEKSYCSETVYPQGGFPFTTRFFVVVEKEVYPTVEVLLDKYMAFDQWPAYVGTVDSNAIIFNKSARLSDKSDELGQTVARHYYDYKLKSPIGYQKVRGVTHNTRLAKAYTGAEATIEFSAQTSGPQEVPAGEKALNGAEGVKVQVGAISAVACTGSNLCNDNQWLLIYETSITPTINLLPKVASASVVEGLEVILLGMLFN